MLSLFKKKKSTVAGVDIGSSSVKLVVLSSGDDGYTLEGYAVVPLPPTAVIDGAIQEQGQVADALEKAVKLSGCKELDAVVAVPSSAVITKRIEMSSAFNELELEEQVKMEADQFIPYPLEEVALDFEVLGPSGDSSELNELLLVACRREDVDAREDSVNEAGLKCKIVDVDSFAVERAFELIHLDEMDGDELIGVVDVGAATLTLNIFRDRQIVYSREQRFGGNELINMIQSFTGLPPEEVDQQMRQGALSEEIVENQVIPFRYTVAQQVSRALQFFYSSGVHNQLSKLYLLGGVSVIPEIVQALESEMAVPTETGNPFLHIGVHSKISASRLQLDAASLVKACGLAMRGDA